jgi:type II secretory pathway pseudopilin PulG
MNSLCTTHTIIRRQRGAAFMVMLVIMIIGVTAMFVASLSSSALQVARNQNTADALAKAKDALIAYAVSDSNRPGELPCPDFNNDGVSEPINDYSGSNCKSLTGWLPWKTLGLPELRDANGDHLWYTVANPFHANGSVALNSDTLITNSTNMLTVIDGATGTTLETNVIAIVFSPGAVISPETRSGADSNASTMAINYLESNNAKPNTSSTPNTTFQTANDKVTPLPTPVVNDRLLTINYTSLFPAVEMRIGREVKSCLDNYALSSGNKFPWAAPVSNTGFQDTANTYFGRIPTWPVADQYIGSFLSSITNLQSALANYITNNNSTTRSALYNAGSILENISDTVASNQPTVPSISGNTTLYANNAGDKTKDLAQNPPQATLQTVQNLLAQTMSYLQADNISNISSGGMNIFWPTGCTFNSTYWPIWQSDVFYQVAQGFEPGSSGTNCGSNCISINGSTPATYRAAVAVARQAIPSINGARIFSTDSTYLEGINPHQTNPSTNFVTNSPASTNYSTNNDLVLCLDGNNYCK